jgi:hypothetical protein
MAARAGPGVYPPPNHPGAPHGRGNRFARLNAVGRPNGTTLPGAKSAFLSNNQPLLSSPMFKAIDNYGRAFLTVLI